ncbi:hypothetical protein [Variovorax sp. PBL-E5]|uniref:hypothetical protein n=1 Tax=Variovorax sp. PBL-E5 TaxID=434014 RepID=UPI001315BBF6|nr:hypothetical protein [Variovorax sp. PBL-E5]VTU37333.1 hypothetical protein E5CHR_04544 [Variovorax sp. PBL-E5]
MKLRQLLPWFGLLPGLAFAQFDPGQAWINAGLYSYHFDRHQGLEDSNPGIGIEWPLDSTYSLTAGVFRNSDRQQSHYVGVYVMPFEFHGVKLGAAVGAFDGYPKAFNGGWFPALIPTAAIEGKHWGLNIAFVPTIKNRLYGALSFQLKYRFSAGE